MIKHGITLPGALLALGLPLAAPAADSEDLAQIRQQIEQLKQTYDARIRELEARLQQAEGDAQAARAAAAAPPAEAGATRSAAGANAFNPGISLILSGIYSNLSRDPGSYGISGFPVPSGTEIGPGKRGFSLAETELGIYANIDPYFYGGLNFAVHPDDTVSTEEAFVQTQGLSRGLTVKAGRFYSGIGYLNEKHAHTWDFADNPLVYQAFLGTQYNEDGVQVRWLAPTDTYLEIGGEVGAGRNFPGSDRSKNGVGASAVFAHAGGDVGISNSWRAGLSFLQTGVRDQILNMPDRAGAEVANAFTGNSHLWIADFVWKYAPNGDDTRTNFKLQGEYMVRRQRGDLIYDTAGANAASSFGARQSGWYLQGVYQFMPNWRVGLRTERLDPGSVDYGANDANLQAPSYRPSKNTFMVDYNPSEFSRIRLQFARDKAREGLTDNQVFLQYQMSLGAHGAHTF